MPLIKLCEDLSMDSSENQVVEVASTNAKVLPATELPPAAAELSPQLAGVVVGALIDFGIRQVVLAPGSRSAALALALAQAERAGLINLHVRIDERSAGFLALGLAKGSGQPAVVVTTSGTAVANLMPAVVEAQYAGVPLLVITADRPTRLRNTGSNQTIDQPGFFGRFVNHSIEFEPAVTADQRERTKWRRQIAQGVAAARGAGGKNQPGPVQINIGFDTPLVASADAEFSYHPEATELEFAAGAAGDWEATREPLDVVLAALGVTAIPTRGVLVLGDEPRPEIQAQAIELAQACGWPVVSEPSGGGFRADSYIAAAPLVLADSKLTDSNLAESALVEKLQPDLVVTIGRVGLSRPVLRLLTAATTHIAVNSVGKDRADPLHTAATLLAGVPSAPTGNTIIPWEEPAVNWLANWLAASSSATTQLADFVTQNPTSSLAMVDQVLQAVAPMEVVFLAASRTVRDAELLLTSSFAGAKIVGNRGVSGIDGLVSTAYGVALSSSNSDSRTYAVLGDLAALHELTGFAVPVQEPIPNLSYIVLDNNGGGIFSGLEQGAPEFAQDFERVFGTPPNIELAAAIRALGAEVNEATNASELAELLAAKQNQPGVQVIVCQLLSREAEQAARTAQL